MEKPRIPQSILSDRSPFTLEKFLENVAEENGLKLQGSSKDLLIILLDYHRNNIN